MGPYYPSCRGARLTTKRMTIIQQFKHRDMSDAGSPAWSMRLFQFMKERDNRVTWEDVKRWMDKHSWIKLRDPVSDVRRSNFTPSIQDMGMNATVPSSETKTNATSQSPVATGCSAPSSIQSEELSTMGNVHNPNILDQSQRINSFNLQYNSLSSDMAATSSVENETIPNHGLNVNGDHAKWNSVRLTDQPPPVRNVDVGPTIPVQHISTFFPNHGINANGVHAEQNSVNGSSHDPTLIEHYFQQGFAAIAVLHEICSFMPMVRTSLIPLKEIHKNFTRSHAKFIFPVGYDEVRKEHPQVVNKFEPITSTTDPSSETQSFIDVE